MVRKSLERCAALAIGAVVSSVALTACQGSAGKDTQASSQAIPTLSTSPSQTSTATSGGAASTTSSSPSADSSGTPNEVIHASNAVVLGSGVDERGDLVTIWNRGYRYDRLTAIAIDRADGGHVVELGPREASIQQSFPGGWIVAGRGAHSLIRLTADGSQTPLPAPRGQVSAGNPGDIVVWGQGGARWDYRPSSNTAFSLESVLRQVKAEPRAVLTPVGGLVDLVQRGTTTQVGRLSDGEWSYTEIDSRSGPDPGDLVRVGNVLAADTTLAPLQPLADGEEAPLHTVAVSLDGGQQWTTALAPRGNHVVLSITATSDGTVFLTLGDPTPGCGLMRMKLGGPVTCLPLRHVGQAFARGDRLYLSSFPPGHDYQLQESTDDGTTWRPVPVPGT